MPQDVCSLLTAAEQESNCSCYAFCHSCMKACLSIIYLSQNSRPDHEQGTEVNCALCGKVHEFAIDLPSRKPEILMLAGLL